MTIVMVLIMIEAEFYLRQSSSFTDARRKKLNPMLYSKN